MAKLVITQTSDLHGFIFPTDYVNSRNWGMSKAYNKINLVNQNHDFKLNIDSGDFIQGSPLAFYLETAYQKSINDQATTKKDFKYLTELLNLVDVDIFTPGNHEFNFGQSYLNQNLNKISANVLCANIDNLNDKILPYQIYTFGDLKVGVIGLTTSYIPNWEKAENIKGLTFNDPISVYKKYEQTLKDSCDLIIVNYHGGLERDLITNQEATELINFENQGSQLLNTFDSIDILLTGHQHRKIATKINDTVVMQPMNNGQCFSKIVVDTITKSIDSFELVPITKDDLESEKINTFLNQTNKDCNLFLDQVLTTLSQDLTITNVEQARFYGHPYANFINSIFCHIMETDISCVSLFDTAIGFNKNLTIRQIILNYPFPNNLIKLELSGKEILEALEQNSNYYRLSDQDEGANIIINPKYLKPKLKSFNYDLFYGLDYKIRVGYQKNQIYDVVINGNPINEDKKYSICINNYRHTTSEEFPVYQDQEILLESDKDVISLLTEFFSSSKQEKLNFNPQINFEITT